MNYIIKIDEFEGPLDLLLHLVKQSNIDIYDINISDITRQYLEYLYQWESLNIEVASEYLVMAATLMEIKSKSLLPNNQSDSSEVDEEVETRDSLIHRLVEYQKYKEATKLFKDLEMDRRNIYTKGPSNINELLDVKFVNDSGVSIDDLMKAFSDFLKRKDMEKPIHTKITNKEYSVKKRKEAISKILCSKKKVDFSDLFDHFNKSYIIVTFLAILELAKEDVVNLVQDANFSNIVIEQKV